MANIKDLKKYIGYEFSSGCYTGDDYKSFQTKYINYLRTMCQNNHWQLENKCVYVSISDVRYFSDEWYNHILIRTAKDEQDYRGGFNNYTTLDGLELRACELLDDLPF